MIRIIDCRTDDPFQALASRSVHRDATTAEIVARILDDVRNRGDAALLDSARRFDAPDMKDLAVGCEEIESATVPAKETEALSLAADRIRAFHERQLEAILAGCLLGGWWSTGKPDVPPFSQPGLGQRYVPLRRVGVYVPGGLATYPSSVLMNAIPAKVASVPSVLVATPARKNGTIAAAVRVALRLAEVDEVVKVGGAAAVAAMAYGTETIQRVDKIVGPGNRFVNEAKRQVWGDVGLDGYAGPSEVCVVVDDTSNAAFAAADLLTQIEHAPDNCGFLVATSEHKMQEVLDQVSRQTTGAEREDTLRKALAGDSLAFIAKDAVQATEIVDTIAPEHLSLAVGDPAWWLERIHNAGCVLMGEFSPESAGDFVAGPSHTLPTSGAARFQSPVNVLDFLKVQSVIHMTRKELSELAPAVQTFGDIEGLPVHGNGAKIRFEEQR